MILDFNRKCRISTIIRKEISNILSFYINDKRINFLVTISDVEISKDLKYAKIFFTILNIFNYKSIKNIIKILNSYKRYIIKLLCKRIILRTVPRLKFYYDNSLSEGSKISKILKKCF
ncbi:30S ribosome-binding factor RbfA [Buchnera aphidicola (Ceratovacuna keduensis)]|uniref:30S ribosome-binding factor RbfA n=1 Tax=Buchnera aphidicola TaxID=9 RepID=UPI0031B85364